MSGSFPSRRPVDLSALEEHVSLLKSKRGIARDDSRRKNVSVPKESLVPMIQADVGREVSVDVARYRLLVPIAQVIAGTAGEIERVVVASGVDLQTIESDVRSAFRRGDRSVGAAICPAPMKAGCL